MSQTVITVALAQLAQFQTWLHLKWMQTFFHFNWSTMASLKYSSTFFTLGRLRLLCWPHGPAEDPEGLEVCRQAARSQCVLFCFFPLWLDNAGRLSLARRCFALSSVTALESACLSAAPPPPPIGPPSLFTSSLMSPSTLLLRRSLTDFYSSTFSHLLSVCPCSSRQH